MQTWVATLALLAGAQVALLSCGNGCKDDDASKVEPRDTLQREKAMLTHAAACEQDVRRKDPKDCQAACTLGHSNSCFRLGTYYESGAAVARDPAKAVTYYRLACEGGSGAGCEEAARCHRDGTGVAKDAAKAAELYKKSRRFHRIWCEQGMAYSCFRLGELFNQGIGGASDQGVAARFYQAACDLNFSAGCYAVKTRVIAKDASPNPRLP